MCLFFLFGLLPWLLMLLRLFMGFFWAFWVNVLLWLFLFFVFFGTMSRRRYFFLLSDFWERGNDEIDWSWGPCTFLRFHSARWALQLYIKTVIFTNTTLGEGSCWEADLYNSKEQLFRCNDFINIKISYSLVDELLDLFLVLFGDLEGLD